MEVLGSVGREGGAGLEGEAVHFLNKTLFTWKKMSNADETENFQGMYRPLNGVHERYIRVVPMYV